MDQRLLGKTPPFDLVDDRGAGYGCDDHSDSERRARVGCIALGEEQQADPAHDDKRNADEKQHSQRQAHASTLSVRDSRSALQEFLADPERGIFNGPYVRCSGVSLGSWWPWTSTESAYAMCASATESRRWRCSALTHNRSMRRELLLPQLEGAITTMRVP